MDDLVLGIDQGTSSTRCVALDGNRCVVGLASVPVSCSFPGPGLVEQDPVELAVSARLAIAQALDATSASEVVALGIANQTETFVVCERDTGRAIHPAIVWQDRRTAARCAELAAAGHAEAVRARTGLELDPTFSATKLAWVLDHVAGARSRARAGELVFHDVAGWLIRSLTGAERCDVGNAGRTLLCGLGANDWDDELLTLFDVPRALMPAIVDSDAIDAVGGSGLDGVRIVAALGDQQASLFGLGCRSRGQAKVTLGTGAFLLVHAGGRPPARPAGVLGSCAWRMDGVTAYALEGFVPAAGSAIDWFSTIGLLPAAAELDALLADAGPEDPSVACVPTLQGLGTPSWQPDIRAGMVGMTRATSRAQIARAIVDGVVHQVVDALAAIDAAMPVSTVSVDGGLARSDWVLQRIADLGSVEVRRVEQSEATAIGAALAAGVAVGRWQTGELGKVQADSVMEPVMSDGWRQQLREGWRAAVEVVERWR